jgi:hypothetical protein
MSLFGSLFARRRARTDSGDAQRIDAAIARIVAMNPRLKNAHHYERKLAAALRTSLRYTDELVASLPPLREASAGAWANDPAIRAIFATPDDLAEAFSRSDTLRSWFDEHADAVEVCAVLGMEMIERHVLGVALEGDSVRHDVPQTTLCFADQRVRVCSDSDASLRVEIGRRLIDQLALEGLASLAADQRDLLRQSRELIEQRVALLERQGTGMRGVVAAPVEADDLARLEAQMEQNAQELARLRMPGKLGELELACLCKVLSKPSEHIYVQSRRMRIDMMNVVQPDRTTAAREIEFQLARIPGNPAVVRAFTLVTFPRRELLPGGLRIDAAMRAI